MARVLEQAGFQVIPAPDVDFAGQCLGHVPPHLVLMEAGVLEAVGMTWLGQVRARVEQSCLSLLVLGEDPGWRRRAEIIEAGADGFLIRPVDTAELVAMVRAQLARAARLSQWQAGEARFRDLIVRQADGVLVVDHEGVIQFANPAAEVMFRRSSSLLVGTAFGFPLEQPGSQAVVLRRADGRPVTAEMRVNASTWEGRPAWLASLRDITLQREAEQRLRESQSQLQMACRIGKFGAWSMDVPKGGCRWSEEALAIHGLDPSDTLTLDQWLALFPSDVQGQLRSAIDRCVSRGDAFDEELHLLRRPGGEAWLRTTGEAVRDDMGRIVRVQGAVQDITERRSMERHLLRAQRMESIGTLAGGIAHDLNNVLSPILMSVDLLRMEELDHRRQQALRTIEASARRGADMVRQVLSFAQGIEGRRLKFDAGHLVADIAMIARETFPRHLRIETEVAHDLWSVMGDPTQIHQVLLNLCVNARDALTQGGRITLAARNETVVGPHPDISMEARPGRYVLLEVTDDGSGIAAELLDRIFEPFFTTKETGRGSGLGLSTSLAIIRSHGGFIVVKSRPGEGSTFRTYLPAFEVDQDLPSSMAADGTPRGKGQCILVVDDEPAIRDVTRQILEAYGYRVRLAADGAEAVAVYREHAGDIALVLTDMMMPVMDGSVTIRALQEIHPRVRIIATSGLDLESLSRREATGSGSPVEDQPFLLKPYNAQSLLQTISAMLEEPR
jgi:PAS domain S-box-containing protein